MTIDNHKTLDDRLFIDYQYQSINWHRLPSIVIDCHRSSTSSIGNALLKHFIVSFVHHQIFSSAHLSKNLASGIISTLKRKSRKDLCKWKKTKRAKRTKCRSIKYLFMWTVVTNNFNSVRLFSMSGHQWQTANTQKAR